MLLAVAHNVKLYWNQHPGTPKESAYLAWEPHLPKFAQSIFKTFWLEFYLNFLCCTWPSRVLLTQRDQLATCTLQMPKLTQTWHSGGQLLFWLITFWLEFQLAGTCRILFVLGLGRVWPPRCQFVIRLIGVETNVCIWRAAPFCLVVSFVLCLWFEKQTLAMIWHHFQCGGCLMFVLLGKKWPIMCCGQFVTF